MKYYLVVALSILIFSFGCKKTSSDTPASTTSSGTTSGTTSSSTTSTTSASKTCLLTFWNDDGLYHIFNFDANGKLLSYADSSNGGSASYEYMDYDNQGHVIKVHEKASNTMYYTFDYNTNGSVARGRQYEYDYSISAYKIYKDFTYSYNSSGQLASAHLYEYGSDYSTDSFIYDASGNVVTWQGFYPPNHTKGGVHKYTYDTKKGFLSGTSLNFLILVDNRFYKYLSKNNAISEDELDENNNELGRTQWTYTYTAEGYPASKDVPAESFIYSCK